MNSQELCQNNLGLAAKPRRAFFEPEKRKSYAAVCILLWSVLSYILITHFVVMAVEIQGISMNPTLADGDKYLLNRFQYLYRAPRKGEIVVIRDPEDHGLSIKRVVGLPGENFEIRRDGVYINGARMDEPYLSEESKKASGHKLIKSITLGEGEYYVMGDNRDYSADSRSYGPLPRHAILGHLSVH